MTFLPVNGPLKGGIRHEVGIIQSVRFRPVQGLATQTESSVAPASVRRRVKCTPKQLPCRNRKVKGWSLVIL